MSTCARKRQVKKLSKAYPVGSLIKYPSTHFVPFLSRDLDFKIGIVLEYKIFPSLHNNELGLLIITSTINEKTFIVHPNRCVLISKPTPTAWNRNG